MGMFKYYIYTVFLILLRNRIERQYLVDVLEFDLKRFISNNIDHSYQF